MLNEILNLLTPDHIIEAINIIEKEGVKKGRHSTTYDLIYNGKKYPPKYVLSIAAKIVGKELLPKDFEGGEDTKAFKYLKYFNFTIEPKSINENDLPIGTIWKLGCNWDTGNPSFYSFIKKESIVIGVTDNPYQRGDIVAIAEGYQILSLGQVLSVPEIVTSRDDFKQRFDLLKIPFESWVNYCLVEWYDLEEEDRIWYQLQAGIRRVQKAEVRKRIRELWQERNSNYWVFQCNPGAFDIHQALRNNVLRSWTVTTHKEKIKVGDKFILWVTGKNSGCYALGNVTSPPAVIGNQLDSNLWKAEDKNPLKATIQIIHNLVDNPLYWANIKTLQGLENLKIGLQGTNFQATREEYHLLLNLIKNIGEVNMNKVMDIKNFILYGPPGTGKTYHSIDKAVQLATGNSGSHVDNKVIFDQLRTDGQVEFVTFHQNYSYEDFMIGLRPNTDNDEVLLFKPHRGIFYELCRRARENYFSSQNTTFEEPTFEEVLEAFLEPLAERDEPISIQMKTASYSFKITGFLDDKRLTFTKQSGGTGHNIYLPTLKALYEGTKSLHPLGLGVYYYPFVAALNEKKLKLTKEKDKETLKNFVLVIDEINRANISRVFGELITLLEEDKRLGAENELLVRLPNGENGFGIPPNLYIIGTMNTADKSIALIDIALRRRFEFIAFYPKYDPVNNYTKESADLLRKINQNILKKNKSVDFLVGHGYLMKSQPISNVIANKIIPLLMEYFSNKIDVVQEIFENTGWRAVYDFEKYQWEISFIA